MHQTISKKEYAEAEALANAAEEADSEKAT